MDEGGSKDEEVKSGAGPEEDALKPETGTGLPEHSSIEAVGGDVPDREGWKDGVQTGDKNTHVKSNGDDKNIELAFSSFEPGGNNEAGDYNGKENISKDITQISLDSTSNSGKQKDYTSNICDAVSGSAEHKVLPDNSLERPSLVDQCQVETLSAAGAEQEPDRIKAECFDILSEPSESIEKPSSDPSVPNPVTVSDDSLSIYTSDTEQPVEFKIGTSCENDAGSTEDICNAQSKEISTNSLNVPGIAIFPGRFDDVETNSDVSLNVNIGSLPSLSSLASVSDHSVDDSCSEVSKMDDLEDPLLVQEQGAIDVAKHDGTALLSATDAPFNKQDAIDLTEGDLNSTSSATHISVHKQNDVGSSKDDSLSSSVTSHTSRDDNDAIHLTRDNGIPASASHVSVCDKDALDDAELSSLSMNSHVTENQQDAISVAADDMNSASSTTHLPVPDKEDAELTSDNCIASSSATYSSSVEDQVLTSSHPAIHSEQSSGTIDATDKFKHLEKHTKCPNLEVQSIGVKDKVEHDEELANDRCGQDSQSKHVVNKDVDVIGKQGAEDFVEDVKSSDLEAESHETQAEAGDRVSMSRSNDGPHRAGAALSVDSVSAVDSAVIDSQTSGDQDTDCSSPGSYHQAQETLDDKIESEESSSSSQLVDDSELSAEVSLDISGSSVDGNSCVRNRFGKTPEKEHLTPTHSEKGRGSAKIRKIQSVLNQASDKDVSSKLRQLAISSGGLMTDELRKQAWPVLLEVDTANLPAKPDSNLLTSHRDHNQVVLDVNRTLKRFPPGMEDKDRLDLQDQLVDVIMRVLVLRPELHYYQGYHDICVTLLLVCGEDLTVALMDKLSSSHLREFLDADMERTRELLSYLYPIIGRANQKLCTFMEKAEVGFVFCLPWLITWYSHVLNNLQQILRLYDFFVACQPLTPIYLAAAIVLYRGDEVLSCEPDMPVIHCLLSAIPDDLPYEKLLKQAGDLYLRYPPQSVKAEAEEFYKSLSAPRPPPSQRDGRVARQIPYNHKKRGGLLFGVIGWSLTIALSAAAIAAWRNTSDWEWLNSVADWHWWIS